MRKKSECNNFILWGFICHHNDLFDELREECVYTKWLIAQLSSKRSTSFSHLAKTSSPMGTGRPPAPLGGITTILEGSRPAYQSGRPG